MPPLPVTAAQALLTSIGNQTKALYSIDNNPVLDPSGFIADPDPAPIFQRPAKQLARQICRVWARQPGPSTNPAADRLYGSACGEYLDSIGEGVEPGTLGPEFEGGQCGILYNVTILTTNYRVDGSVEGSGSDTLGGRVGPIGGISYDSACSSTIIGPLAPGAGGFCAYLTDGSGRTLIGGNGNGGTRKTITSIVPLSGTDNCGNPPPQYERPRPPITLPPITPIFIDLPDIGEIEVNVNIDAEGLITVESPTLNVEVNLGGPDGAPGGGGGGGDVVPDGGLSGAPADTGNGGTAAGEAPPGQELVGVRVEVLESPIGANTYDRVATTVYRGIGYVRMGYPGRLALDMGGAAVISPQFFLAPVRGLTNWEVRANNGFINRVTPFYRELPS